MNFMLKPTAWRGVDRPSPNIAWWILFEQGQMLNTYTPPKRPW